METKPTKYKQEYCQELIDFMAQGYSYTSFAAHINVGRSTIYKWEDDFPEFKAAKEIALDKAKTFFETRLLAKMSGRKVKKDANFDPKLVDTSCLIFALKTRFHKDYGEKQKHEIETGEQGIVIKIDSDDAGL